MANGEPAAFDDSRQWSRLAPARFLWLDVESSEWSYSAYADAHQLQPFEAADRTARH